jgi:hypothetical protein
MVRVPPAAHEAAMNRRTPPASLRAPPRAAPDDTTSAELDRLLDKISAEGIASLSSTERRFLDEVSQRKQKDLH